MTGKRLADETARAEALEAEVAILKGLVLRLVVAAVDPDEFDDLGEYVSEIFGFCEVNSDAGPATEAEIDELTSIVLEAYDFDGDDEDDEDDDDATEDGEEGGEDG